MALGTVTNARASGDYHAGSDQWRPLGTTGIFGWAVAIAPTKDNYWSTDKQAGSAYGDYAKISEPYNRLQAAVSTLTKGPVAPSDKIGASDTALILKSCAADGKLLQGDKPAMLIDSAHVLLAFSGGGPSHGRSKECRITVKPDPCPVAKSGAGYSAWTAMDKKSGGGFAEHDGEFCDCGGNGSCEKWAWAGEMADQKACEAKANKLGASCFDYNGPRMDESDTVDLAPPAGNITGPVGEVWVTHTELDRHKFGVAMAAMLRNDYTLSLGEQPRPLPKQLARLKELVRVVELRMLLLPALVGLKHRVRDLQPRTWT